MKKTLKRIGSIILATVLIIGLFAFYPGTAYAAIAKDTSQLQEAGTCNNTGTGNTFSYTAAANSLIVVAVGSASIGHSGITWNGNALTQIGTTQNTGAGQLISMWRYYTASGGTGTVAVTTVSNVTCVIGVISFTGVDSASPIAANAQESEFGGAGGSGSSLNINTTVDNAWIVSAVLHTHGTDVNFTAASGQTKELENTNATLAADFAMGYEGPFTPSGTQASNWTVTPTFQYTGQVLASIAPSSGGGSPPPQVPDLPQMWVSSREEGPMFV
jgi:hypothetical protein